MAYRSFVDCWAYGAGYNVGQYLETIGSKRTSQYVALDLCGSTAATITLTGRHTSELTMAGPYETTVFAPAYGVAGLTGTDKVWCCGFEGDTVSQRFWGWRAAQVSEIEMGLSPEDVDRITPAIAINGPCNEGYIVAPLAARTTAGNTQSTYADMASSSTAARAFIVVTSLTLGGYTSLTVTPQSSDDHISFADETAFTNITAIGAESVALSGTVNRYLAVKWAWNGAGTGQSATFFVGVSRD